MPPCAHGSREYIGVEKTDDGVNAYHKCVDCGALLVTLPSKEVVGVPGVRVDHRTNHGGNTS